MALIETEIKPLQDVIAEKAPSIIHKAGEPYSTKVVSVNTLAGPKGGLGEICHILLYHGGQFHFVEGQYLGVILHPDEDDDSFHTPFRVAVHDFSIASCRDGDFFHGEALSLCVLRADLLPGSISNYLCNAQKGDEVDIIGPFGKTMVFSEDPEAKHIMVATLTGIAPFRSNMQRLFVDPKSTVKFNGLAWLFFGADNYNSLLYNDEFSKILKDNPDHFRYETSLNNSVAEPIYENGDDIFTFLDDGAYIYFSGSKTMMPGILEAFTKKAEERGVVWEDMLARLKKNNQWRVEVY